MTVAKKILNDNPANGQLADYFYKITNHTELYKRGNELELEVEKGVKNFAFTSTGYRNFQQKTVLGLCCYFDQHTDFNVAIISDLLLYGIFNDLVMSSKKKSFAVGNEGNLINYHSFFHHFDFIDYEEFEKLWKRTRTPADFQSLVKDALDFYDVILWDIPEIEAMNKNPEFYGKISHFYESITVIVNQNTTSGKQIDLIKKFFGNYNINLNGVLFETDEDKEKPKRKKFLGLFG